MKYALKKAIEQENCQQFRSTYPSDIHSFFFLIHLKRLGFFDPYFILNRNKNLRKKFTIKPLFSPGSQKKYLPNFYSILKRKMSFIIFID
jgi:hypothetical protein